MIPRWLQRTRAGDAYRAATLRLCPRCKAPILIGLNYDICAWTVRADPTPLTQLGEAVALLAGRTTFDLTSSPGRKELSPREDHHINAPRRFPILPEHKCGAPLHAFASPMPKKERKADHARPPF